MSSSSSSASGLYASALRTASDMQHDLASALSTIRSLRQENENLVETQVKLKLDLAGSRSLLDDARKHAMNEAEARIASERRVEASTDRWRHALALKEQEVVSLTASIVAATAAAASASSSSSSSSTTTTDSSTNNNNALYAEISLLQHDLTSTKEKLQLITKEYDSYKQSQSSLVTTLTSDIEVSQAGHKAELAETQHQLQAVTSQVDTMIRTHAIEVRELRAVAEAAAARATELSAEAAELRSERNTLKSKLATSDIVRSREVTEQITQTRDHESIRASLERKVASSEAETATLRARLAECTARLGTASADVQSLRGEVQHKDQAHLDEISRMSSRHAQAKFEWETEKRGIFHASDAARSAAVQEVTERLEKRIIELEKTVDENQIAATNAEMKVIELTTQLNALRSKVVVPHHHNGGGGAGSTSTSRRGSISASSIDGERIDGGKYNSSSSNASAGPTTTTTATTTVHQHQSSLVRHRSSNSSSGGSPPKPFSSRAGGISLSAIRIQGNGLLLPSSSPSSSKVGRGMVEEEDAHEGGGTDEDAFELHDMMNNHENSIDALREEVSYARGEASALRHTVQDLRTSIAALQAQVTQGSANVHEATRQRNDAETRARDSEANLRMLLGRLESADVTGAELARDLARAKEVQERERVSALALVQATRASLEQALSIETEGRLRAQEEALQLHHSFQQMQKKAAAYKQKLLKLYEMYQIVKAAAADANAARLVAAAGKYDVI